MYALTSSEYALTSSDGPHRLAIVICTLRVCGRKNYRLQDIQLSKSYELSSLALGPRASRWLTSLAGPHAPLRSFALPDDARRAIPNLPNAERWAIKIVENTGLEPVTSWLQTRRSPS